MNNKISPIDELFNRVGLDSVSFTIPKLAFEKFLRKFDFKKHINKTTRNLQLKDYCDDKFKSHNTKDKKAPFEIKYINFIKGNKSLSNTAIILYNSKKALAKAKKNKKAKGYYIEIIINGINQPSKNIAKETMAFLTRLLRRFKTDSVDLSLDFSGNFDMKKQSVRQAIDTFKNLDIKGDFVEYNQSFYINNVKYKQLSQLNRLILYDKFHKQKNYHKQNINEKFCKWRRLELRLNIKNKLIRSLDTIKEALKLFSLFLKSLNNQNITRKFLNYQFSVFKDLRKNKHIKALNLFNSV
ncbi:hypothetical protein [Campylobacter subantarcticus]|uniref:Uncharacterized protein n=1 Tax=Campylobacter subantarcticus LMG 24374 TaxID=1388751 RepID=A0A0A8HC09_9BACT|nr:hypothetical protein [Campylobacter subantarcticus]AJC91472.1 hypothetical protein CSUB8521_1663 [Campylobacter subantarcticus LMG 24374]EAJ1261456.1 hypothetical protein [Campylobacter lari]